MNTSTRRLSLVAPRREYVLHFQESALEIGSLPDMNASVLRLYLVSLGRMNDGGHAIFDRGELRRLLGKVDKETGELVPVCRDTIYDSKRKLYKAGALVESSGGETCVWISGMHATRKAKGGRCPRHPFPMSEEAA
jgi:hypothetical protein